MALVRPPTGGEVVGLVLVSVFLPILRHLGAGSLQMGLQPFFGDRGCALERFVRYSFECLWVKDLSELLPIYQFLCWV